MRTLLNLLALLGGALLTFIAAWGTTESLGNLDAGGTEEALGWISLGLLAGGIAILSLALSHLIASDRH